MSGTTSVTTSNSPNPAFLNAYQNLLTQAGNVASQPLQQYQGQQVAGMTPDQTAAINTVDSSQGIAYPYINQASQYFGQATQPLWSGVQQYSPGAISQYQSPYTQQVVDATQAQFNNQNAQAQQNETAGAVSQGAYGGDRQAVASAQLAGQEQTAQAPVIAGLENQGYAQALQEFNQQQGAQLGANEANSWLNSQAGFGTASLGQEAQSTALTGANAQFGLGTAEQQQAQAQLNVPYEQFQQQQAYPFQTTNWLSGITEGTGNAAGGTGTTTTQSNPSTLSTAAGLGTAALGIVGATGGFGSSSGGSGWVSQLGNWISSWADGGEVARASGGGIADAVNDNGHWNEPHRATGTHAYAGGGGISVALIPGTHGNQIPMLSEDTSGTSAEALADYFAALGTNTVPSTGSSAYQPNFSNFTTPAPVPTPAPSNPALPPTSGPSILIEGAGGPNSGGGTSNSTDKGGPQTKGDPNSTFGQIGMAVGNAILGVGGMGLVKAGLGSAFGPPTDNIAEFPGGATYGGGTTLGISGLDGVIGTGGANMAPAGTPGGTAIGSSNMMNSPRDVAYGPTVDDGGAGSLAGHSGSSELTAGSPADSPVGGGGGGDSTNNEVNGGGNYERGGDIPRRAEGGPTAPITPDIIDEPAPWDLSSWSARALAKNPPAGVLVRPRPSIEDTGPYIAPDVEDPTFGAMKPGDSDVTPLADTWAGNAAHGLAAARDAIGSRAGPNVSMDAGEAALDRQGAYHGIRNDTAPPAAVATDAVDPGTGYHSSIPDESPPGQIAPGQNHVWDAAASGSTDTGLDDSGTLDDGDLPLPPDYVPPPKGISVASTGGGPGVSGARPATSNKPPPLPSDAATQGGDSKSGGWSDARPDAPSNSTRDNAKWMGLMSAGLGMLAGRGSGIQNIGSGALEGLRTYEHENDRADQQDARKQTADHQAAVLSQTIEASKARIAQQDAALQERARHDAMLENHSAGQLAIAGGHLGIAAAGLTERQRHDLALESKTGYSWQPGESTDADGNIVKGSWKFPTSSNDTSPPVFVPGVVQQRTVNADQSASQFATRQAQVQAALAEKTREFEITNGRKMNDAELGDTIRLLNSTRDPIKGPTMTPQQAQTTVRGLGNNQAPAQQSVSTPFGPGSVMDGFRFNGGDPTNRNNWTPVP